MGSSVSSSSASMRHMKMDEGQHQDDLKDVFSKYSPSQQSRKSSYSYQDLIHVPIKSSTNASTGRSHHHPLPKSSPSTTYSQELIHQSHKTRGRSFTFVQPLFSEGTKSNGPPPHHSKKHQTKQIASTQIYHQSTTCNELQEEDDPLEHQVIDSFHVRKVKYRPSSGRDVANTQKRLQPLKFSLKHQSNHYEREEFLIIITPPTVP
ncbi:hypothetical protein C9374_002870 [Naegleria lovaniensis]|uniref:Uncharacterized protein n=1 Tax=Naegleria lovaniensis TaxID=51637 RepID=A0AA88KM11_NAELO|nr:uncharacterized protein C9374_002870 [Naegleria lovaniensis]KAG2386424.1 hypothetical protein C9374_002870 [Naegleria lovaniensis]